MSDDGIHEFLAGPEIERLGLAFNALDMIKQPTKLDRKLLCAVQFRTNAALPPNPIIIKRVSVDTWADEEGIQPGDVLLALNGVDVSGMSADEFKATMQVRPLSVRIAEVWLEEESEKKAEEKRATVFDTDADIASRIECLAETHADSGKGENNCVKPEFTGQSNETEPLLEKKPPEEMNASGEQRTSAVVVVPQKDDSRNVADKVETGNKDRPVARRMMMMRPSLCCGQQ